jgi:hypothetical protein
VSKPAYIIRIDSVPAISVHQVRNFAEDVSRALRDEPLGNVLNMDTATSEVRVEVAATRHSSRVLRVVRLQLARHHFVEHAVVSRD